MRVLNKPTLERLLVMVRKCLTRYISIFEYFRRHFTLYNMYRLMYTKFYNQDSIQIRRKKNWSKHARFWWRYSTNHRSRRPVPDPCAPSMLSHRTLCFSALCPMDPSDLIFLCFLVRPNFHYGRDNNYNLFCIEMNRWSFFRINELLCI